MKILIISPDYPDKKRSVYTFVKQVVDQFTMQGNRCCVIAPYSITKNRGFYKLKENENTKGSGVITILRPNYLSFSNFRILGFSPSLYFRSLALRKALKMLPFVPDIIYAHFWRSGKEIYSYAKANGIPLFIASGESQIPLSDISPTYKEFYDYVSGVICVSSKNMEESILNGMTTKEKCIVLPNGINSQIFKLQDKAKCRERLNLPSNVFIVAFCGALCHRKGVKILSDAINKIEEPVYSVFMGKPMDELPSCKHILYQGPVKHTAIADYLNAADIFVLPTLHEGCCNAIIEAMACGLPVVSSNLPFNWDILNEGNSIMISPENVEEIRSAILTLMNDKMKRHRLSNGALNTASSLSISDRVKKILSFIGTKLQ